MNRHITCPKVRLGKKVMFSGPNGHFSHLEVIWRSFGDSKLNSDERNRLSIPKRVEKDILHAQK